MSDKSDLAALLGSRICHDLISPIGAIGNGLELLMMEAGAGGPEMALISESVGHANARIRFFRVAFGAYAGEQRLGRSEVSSIINDMTRGGRLSIEWHSGPDMARGEVKIAFLLLMCLESAMAYGGKIIVQVDGGRWQINGDAAKLRIDAALWDMLADPTANPEITPAVVHFPLAADEITRRQYRLTAELSQTSIKLSF